MKRLLSTFWQAVRNEAGFLIEPHLVVAILLILLAIVIPHVLRFLGVEPPKLEAGPVSRLAAVIVVLCVGSVILSILFEFIAGLAGGDLGTSGILADLPAYKILFVILVGGGLSFWHGWISTGIILGVDAAFCVLGGLYCRRLLRRKRCQTVEEIQTRQGQ